MTTVYEFYAGTLTKTGVLGGTLFTISNQAIAESIVSDNGTYGANTENNISLTLSVGGPAQTDSVVALYSASGSVDEPVMSGALDLGILDGQNVSVAITATLTQTNISETDTFTIGTLGTVAVSGTLVRQTPPPDDFYGNGTSDVLFRNDATGDSGYYLMENGASAGWNDFGASSTAFSVVGTGDFYGNGTDDILFRDNATGDTGYYTIVNGVNTGWHDIGASSTAYHVVG